MMESYKNTLYFKSIRQTQARQSLTSRFLGSKILVTPNARTKLPHQQPDEPYPIWKVLKSFIGQDLSKVSLPIGMNEPLTGLQKICEFMSTGEHLHRTASVTEDPVRRLALSTIGCTCAIYTS